MESWCPATRKDIKLSLTKISKYIYIYIYIYWYFQNEVFLSRSKKLASWVARYRRGSYSYLEAKEPVTESNLFDEVNWLLRWRPSLLGWRPFFFVKVQKLTFTLDLSVWHQLRGVSLILTAFLGKRSKKRWNAHNCKARNKKLLGAPGLTTRSILATRNKNVYFVFWHFFHNVV